MEITKLLASRPINIEAKSETNSISEIRQSQNDLSQASVGNVIDQAQDGVSIKGVGTQQNYAPDGGNYINE
ncbi:MAG: hypothetical protein F6K14_07570 [Symploca sp. SIO2C1]|nr:hypothetical protein [Symploca sp. SIO2C1]